MPSPEWRECPEGGKVHKHEGGGWRECRWLKRVAGIGATMETCASCPIPDRETKAKLWDACGGPLVEAAKEMLSDLLASARLECQAQRDSKNCPDCPRDWVCPFALQVASWRAALAAAKGLTK